EALLGARFVGDSAVGRDGNVIVLSPDGRVLVGARERISAVFTPSSSQAKFVLRPATINPEGVLLPLVPSIPDGPFISPDASLPQQKFSTVMAAALIQGPLLFVLLISLFRFATWRRHNAIFYEFVEFLNTVDRLTPPDSAPV